MSYFETLAEKPYSRLAIFDKGTVIIHPDSGTNHIHIVRSGLVKAYGLNTKGDENIVVIYGPGELFPLAWIINQQQLAVYFKAMVRCEILLVPKQDFIKEIQTNAPTSYVVIQKIIEQYVMYASRVSNLGLQYARERIAYILLVLAARLGEYKFGMITIPYISQRDLAAAVNVARESVSREISRLERLRIIDYTQARILIVEPTILRQELGKDVAVAFYDDAQKPVI